MEVGSPWGKMFLSLGSYWGCLQEKGKPQSWGTVLEGPLKLQQKSKSSWAGLGGTHLWLGQSSHLTCNTRHPCKDEVGGVICTSSLPVPSDLFESQIQILVFIPVKLLSFKLHWSYFTWADLPAEPHPAQCPQRLPAHTPALQGSFFSFQHSCK